MDKELIDKNTYASKIAKKFLILSKKNSLKLEYLNGYMDAKLEKEKMN